MLQFIALLVAVVYAVPLDGDKGETAPIVADDMETAEFFHKAHKAKAHKGGYGAPKAAYGAPKAAYGAPPKAVKAKAPKAPKAAYGAPKAAYHAPAPAYHAPAPAYHAPAPVYGAPKAKGLKAKAHKGAY